MRSSLLFFTLYLRLTVPGRFIPLFYQFHGLSPANVGVVLALSNVAILASNPLIAYVADKSNRHHVLAVTQLTALFFFLLQSLGYFLSVAPVPILVTCAILYGAFTRPADTIVSAITLDRLAVTHGHKRAPLYFGSVRLWGAVSWAIGSCALGTILDTVQYFAAPTNDSPDDSNQQNTLNFRMLAVFYALAPFVFLIHIATALYDRTDAPSIKADEENGVKSPLLPKSQSRAEQDRKGEESVDEEDGISRMTLKARDNNKGNGKDDDSERPGPASQSSSPAAGTDNSDDLNFLQAIRPVVCSGGLWTLLFFALTFSLGFGMSIVENLIFVYFRDDLSASYTLCGLTVFITVVFEIPLFARAEYMLSVCGAPGLLTIGALSYVVRAFGYSVVPSAWHALFLEPLHGLTFAAVHASSVAIVAARAPRRYQATAQAVLVFVAVAASFAGVFTGGFVIQYFGSRILYRLCSFAVLAVTVMFVLVNFISPLDFTPHSPIPTPRENTREQSSSSS